MMRGTWTLRATVAAARSNSDEASHVTELSNFVNRNRWTRNMKPDESGTRYTRNPKTNGVAESVVIRLDSCSQCYNTRCKL